MTKCDQSSREKNATIKGIVDSLIDVGEQPTKDSVVAELRATG